MGQLDVETVTNALTGMLDILIGKSRDTLAVMAQDSITCPDATDRATVETDRHMALILRERDRQLMGEIQAALARVKDGEYGVCQECGEDIDPARLRAQPTATLCVHCKTMLEALGRPAMLPARPDAAFFGE